MITIFYNPFRSAWKLGMWTRFRAIVERMFSTSTAPALLIGNYRLGEVDWDAILVAGKEVFLFEFKTQVTRSIIITNKKWMDENGHKIFPGSRQETPFLQLRINVIFSEEQLGATASMRFTRLSCFQRTSNYWISAPNLI